jgi:hypothetical protein
MVLAGWAAAPGASYVAILVSITLYLVHQTQMTFRRNLEARKEQREQAWQIDGWAETVSKVSLFDLALEMTSGCA